MDDVSIPLIETQLHGGERRCGAGDCDQAGHFHTDGKRGQGGGDVGVEGGQRCSRDHIGMRGKEGFGEADAAQLERATLCQHAGPSHGELGAAAAQVDHAHHRIAEFEADSRAEKAQAGFFRARDDLDLEAGIDGNVSEELRSVDGATCGAGGCCPHFGRGDSVMSGQRSEATKDLGSMGPSGGLEVPLVAQPPAETHDGQLVADGTALVVLHQQEERVGADVDGGSHALYQAKAGDQSGLVKPPLPDVTWI